MRRRRRGSRPTGARFAWHTTSCRRSPIRRWYAPTGPWRWASATAPRPGWPRWRRSPTTRAWPGPTSSRRDARTCYGAQADETTPSAGTERRWRPTVPSQAATICAGGSPSAADNQISDRSGMAAYAQFTVEIQRPARLTRELAAGGSRDDAGRHQQHFGQRQAVPAGYRRTDVIDDRLQITPAGPRCSFGDDDYALADLICGRSRYLVRRHRKRCDKARSHFGRRLCRGGLDILRIVVAAIHDDQIFHAPGDVELTVQIDAEIPGPQPGGVARRPVSMAACQQSALQLVAEYLLGFLGACPVTTANVVAVQPDFADLPVG